MKKVIFGCVLALALTSSVMAGGPMVNVWMETASGLTSLDVTAGQVVDFVIKAQIAPVGTSNVNVTGTTNDTITSLVSGKDGVTSVRVNLFQNVSDAIQVSFTSMVLPTQFAGIASGVGVVDARGNGYNNIEGHKAVLNVQAAAVPSLDAVVVGTGSFTVMNAPLASASMVQLSFLGSNSFGGDASVGNFAALSAGGFKIKNGTVIAVGSTDYSSTADGNIFGYQGLTLTTVPEPMTLGLLAMGGVALLRRKLA